MPLTGTGSSRGGGASAPASRWCQLECHLNCRCAISVVVFHSASAHGCRQRKARVTMRYAGFLVDSIMVGPPGLEPGTIRL